MTIRQISVSEFKAHCTEEIREVEKGELILELTRHGKTVAVVQSAASSPTAPDLSEWLGSGKGMVKFSSSYDPSGAAWDSSDWEE